MSSFVRLGASAALLLGLAACASVPSGPSMLVLPGTGKSFDQFRNDDLVCRNFAQQQTGSSAQAFGEDSGVRSAAVGTAVGAVAGAAIGGSRGAGIGAGTGLLFGSASGSSAASSSASTMQRRYDNAYIQCMYAQGHRVPVSGQLREAPTSYRAVPPPPSGAVPAPPPGVRR